MRVQRCMCNHHHLQHPLTGAFVVPAGMNKAELERQAVWPSQAAEQPDKLIKLPGQTKVGEDEYKEFLNLGHGGIFDLDLTRYATGQTHYTQQQHLHQLLHISPHYLVLPVINRCYSCNE